VGLIDEKKTEGATFPLQSCFLDLKKEMLMSYVAENLATHKKIVLYGCRFKKLDEVE
jgi:hypothetical protein